MATAKPGGDRWCVVTGGRGFAARHLVEMLLRSDEGWHVRIADLGAEIKLDPHEENGLLAESLRSGRAAYVAADLRRKLHVIRAFQGAEVVFHMAAPDSSINNYQLHYSVNVEGTKNVIDACIECKVKRLIYTSSPSVVFDGVHGIHIGIETMPYPSKFNDSYSETKAEGEKLVMKANGRNGLLTCCIRPSSIFGPGDKLMVPSLVVAAKAGKSKFIIGDGNNFYDFTYVENVAYGHICAERTLAYGERDKAGGQAYFITNMEPMKFWEFMSRILEGLGYERPRFKIPASLMMPIAHLVELTYKILGPYGMPVPQLTPSRVRLLSCNRTFSSSKAEDQLGYKPIVSLEEGIRRTIESFSHLKSEQQIVREFHASHYLGSIKAAKMHMWRDKKQTITILLVLATIYYFLFASGYTAITAMAKLLSLVSLFLFIHGMLPEKILGYRIEKVPPSYFQLTDEKSRNFALCVTSSWNKAANDLKSLCKGKDWPLFFKVLVTLSVLGFLGSMSPKSVFEIGIPLIFISLYLYGRWENEVDELFDEIFSQLLKLKSNMVKKVNSD